jgi:hypothetical protein
MTTGRQSKPLFSQKPVGFADDQHEGQSGEQTDTGMRHRSLRFGKLLQFPLDRLAQFRNRLSLLARRRAAS